MAQLGRRGNLKSCFLWVRIPLAVRNKNNTNMDTLKKFFYFFAICVFALGIGCAFNTLHDHEWVLGFSGLLTSAMAFPFVKDCAKKLMA